MQTNTDEDILQRLFKELLCVDCAQFRFLELQPPDTKQNYTIVTSMVIKLTLNLQNSRFYRRRYQNGLLE
jgi:hypothetical protein